jgi:hypothetical protein
MGTSIFIFQLENLFLVKLTSRYSDGTDYKGLPTTADVRFNWREGYLGNEIIPREFQKYTGDWHEWIWYKISRYFLLTM